MDTSDPLAEVRMWERWREYQAEKYAREDREKAERAIADDLRSRGYIVIPPGSNVSPIETSIMEKTPRELRIEEGQK